MFSSFVSSGARFSRLAAWAALLLLLSWSCVQAGPEALSDMFRQVLAERLLSATTASTLKETPLLPSDARRIVRKHLDRDALSGVRRTSGTDFRFVVPGQQTDAQVAVLILTYEDEKAALRANGTLAGRGVYFKDTKILTRFSSTAMGHQVAVAFTENSGSPSVVQFIDDVPELLKSRDTVRFRPACRASPYDTERA